MKTAPLIVISPSTRLEGTEEGGPAIDLADTYSAAILAAGGIPWILPCAPDRQLVAECVRRSQGVLLTGGDDVQPGLYSSTIPGEVKETLGPHDPRRDLQDLMLVDEAFTQRKPLLAICRGQQLLNVALGGTLVMDIVRQVPGAINHARTDKRFEIVHEVTLTPGSNLAKITGKEKIGVNSSHHQAIDCLAGPLQATARSPDGIIEGVELREAMVEALPYLVAVQYHPERLFDRHSECLELFRSFTRACRSHNHS